MRNSEKYSQLLNDSRKFIDRVNKMTQKFNELTKSAERIEWAIERFDRLDENQIANVDNVVGYYTDFINQHLTCYDHPDHRQSSEQFIEVKESSSNIVYRTAIYIGAMIAQSIYSLFHRSDTISSNDSEALNPPAAAHNESAVNADNEHETLGTSVVGAIIHPINDICG